MSRGQIVEPKIEGAVHLVVKDKSSHGKTSEFEINFLITESSIAIDSDDETNAAALQAEKAAIFAEKLIQSANIE